MAAIIDGTSGITSPTYNGTVTAEYSVPVTAFKNRIINGAMLIDQRNNGASVTINSASNTYTLDRWIGYGQATDGVYTIQQSSTAPTGFSKSLLATVTTADSSVGATQIYTLRYKIEGLNLTDLNWGTANAATVTLSFWVRSSVTGTFGGSILNDGQSRSYPFSYTISSANTWEQKTITIAGDTSGTWLTTNGIGMDLFFSLGMGSTYSGTASTWSGTNYYSVTGSTNLISTLNATLYITGVQLEKGSTATSFDYRPYGTELALCQRYFYMHVNGAVNGNNLAIGMGIYYSTVELDTIVQFPVTMRTTPTLYAASGTDYYVFYRNSGSDTFNSFTIQNTNTTSAGLYNLSQASGTAGQGGVINTFSASAYVGFSAEL